MQKIEKLPEMWDRLELISVYNTPAKSETELIYFLLNKQNQLIQKINYLEERLINLEKGE